MTVTCDTDLKEERERENDYITMPFLLTFAWLPGGNGSFLKGLPSISCDSKQPEIFGIGGLKRWV